MSETNAATPQQASAKGLEGTLSQPSRIQKIVEKIRHPFGKREAVVHETILEGITEAKPDQVFADILEGAQNNVPEKPGLRGQFEEAQPGSGHPIVGDEIISPLGEEVQKYTSFSGPALVPLPFIVKISPPFIV